MQEERQVVRLGGTQGVSGDSPDWQVKVLGRVLRTRRARLRTALAWGWLTGIEDVRREDGDWGPLFGRAIYREVFGEVHPRDHARARAQARIARLRRAVPWLVGGAVAACALGLPGVGTVTWTRLMLLLAAVLGVASGLVRLLAALHARELEALGDRLVPRTLPPPPPEDWARRAAEDEVDSLLRADPAADLVQDATLRNRP